MNKDSPVIEAAGHIVALAGEIHRRHSERLSFDQALRLANDLYLSFSDVSDPDAVEVEIADSFWETQP